MRQAYERRDSWDHHWQPHKLVPQPEVWTNKNLFGGSNSFVLPEVAQPKKCSWSCAQTPLSLSSCWICPWQTSLTLLQKIPHCMKIIFQLLYYTVCGTRVLVPIWLRGTEHRAFDIVFQIQKVGEWFTGTIIFESTITHTKVGRWVHLGVVVGGKCLVCNGANTVCFAKIVHKVIDIFTIAKRPHLLHKPWEPVISQLSETTWANLGSKRIVSHKIRFHNVGQICND
jgi:hypothetical protein